MCIRDRDLSQRLEDLAEEEGTDLSDLPNIGEGTAEKIHEILDMEDVEEVLGKGEERISMRLTDGLQVDFRFFEESSLGSAMMYFTGSKAHNIKLRQLAVERGWKLNEYGLFKGDHLLAGKSEESVYHRLNLDWIPPELREDRGEVEAAQGGELPGLVEPDQIRGDLQSRTDAHKPQDLDFMPYGVDVARRGWPEKKDVLNTRTVKQLRKIMGME